MLGEYAENEVRKDFTVSERVAIAKAVGGRPREDEPIADLFEEEIVQNFAQLNNGTKTREVAAQKAGFNNHESYRQAAKVVVTGTPELVEAMDTGKVSISAAATIATVEPGGC